jgi:hypothetical protein
MIRGRHAGVVTLAFLSGLSTAAHAQIGTGWTRYSPSHSVQLRGTNTHYSNVNGIETFTMKSGDERAEARVADDYSSGQRQFEGYVRVSYGEGTSVHQVFKFLMVVYYPTLGGELRQHSGTPMVSGITGDWVRVNTIHNVASGGADVYINGSKKAHVSQASGPWYHKYGVYNCGAAGAKSEWKSIRYWRK